jgi:fused signal recognition particle receptor
VKFLSALSERLRDGLKRSQEYLAGSLGTVLDTDRPIDDALLEELEELLIAADLGAQLAADFTNRAREELMFGTVASSVRSSAASSSTRWRRRRSPSISITIRPSCCCSA